jgi:hypothetical protein
MDAIEYIDTTLYKAYFILFLISLDHTLNRASALQFLFTTESWNP